MKSFKEHLLEKAQIVQQRNDYETALYQKRQQEYQLHQETMTMEEHESFKKFCEETLFRIQILEKRLNKVIYFLGLYLIFFIA